METNKEPRYIEGKPIELMSKKQKCKYEGEGGEVDRD